MLVLPLAISMPGPVEWIIIAAIGLIIFGKRLPEVGRSLGQGIVEFKKGLKGVGDEVAQVDDQRPTTPRPAMGAELGFDPYTGEPLYMKA